MLNALKMNLKGFTRQEILSSCESLILGLRHGAASSTTHASRSGGSRTAQATRNGDLHRKLGDEERLPAPTATAKGGHNPQQPTGGALTNQFTFHAALIAKTADSPAAAAMLEAAWGLGSPRKVRTRAADAPATAKKGPCAPEWRTRARKSLRPTQDGGKRPSERRGAMREREDPMHSNRRERRRRVPSPSQWQQPTPGCQQPRGAECTLAKQTREQRTGSKGGQAIGGPRRDSGAVAQPRRPASGHTYEQWATDSPRRAPKRTPPSEAALPCGVRDFRRLEAAQQPPCPSLPQGTVASSSHGADKPSEAVSSATLAGTAASSSHGASPM